MPEQLPTPNTSPGRGTYSAKLKWESMMDRCWKSLQKADCIIACVIICCLTPAVVVLSIVISKNMTADDGIVTADELKESLRLAEINCKRSLENAPAPTDKNGNRVKKFCKGEWDGLTCWPNSLPGMAEVPCPKYIVDFDHNGSAGRHCPKTGIWSTEKGSNRTWVDYTQCTNVKEDMQNKTNGKLDFFPITPNPTYQRLVNLYTVGYAVSLVTLIFALITLAYFKRLHCTRNYIHMHLFVSFMLRAIIIFVKDGVLFYGTGILDINSDVTAASVEANQSLSYEIGCRIVMTLFHYLLATNYYWIVVEALYLHSLIFVAFFSDRKYLWRFIFTGWGIPILFVVPWAIVRARFDEKKCWDLAVSEYKWIYIGPIVVANVINFLLFLNITRVLFQKLKEKKLGGKSDNRRRQYMKLAKATLVLIPLFGCHALVFIWLPDSTDPESTVWLIRMYFDHFFNSFQGFFVAIIYCFLNGEVQAEVKRAWDRFNTSVQIRRGRRERSRSSVTMLTNFSSYSQGGRLSISENGRSQTGHMQQEGDSNPLIYDNTSVDEEPASRFRTTFIRRTYSDSIQRNSNTELILPIAEERDIEEKAFESAMESNAPLKYTPLSSSNNILHEDIFAVHEESNSDKNASVYNSSIDSGYAKELSNTEPDDKSQSAAEKQEQGTSNDGGSRDSLRQSDAKETNHHQELFT